MTTPSVPRCGRMDEHEPHEWSITPAFRMNGYLPTRKYRCPGVVVHEGGARCADCGSVVCRCEQELADERRAEWDS